MLINKIIGRKSRQRRRQPLTLTGEMFKRDTFADPALSLGTRFGVKQADFLKNDNELVMKEPKKVRDKWLNIRVNEDEYKKIEGLCNSTTCHAVSDYARNVLLKKPVVVKYHNQFADELLSGHDSAKK